mmetsp:Transcript_20439/g.81752  ORF Transcript_20439/g.81752 Transcript_20439/m.81752 type:complete len:201 (-) Transcript_20439:46-648(-)
MSSSKTAKPPVQASYRASAHRGHSTPRRLAASASSAYQSTSRRNHACSAATRRTGSAAGRRFATSVTTRGFDDLAVVSLDVERTSNSRRESREFSPIDASRSFSRTRAYSTLSSSPKNARSVACGSRTHSSADDSGASRPVAALANRWHVYAMERPSTNIAPGGASGLVERPRVASNRRSHRNGVRRLDPAFVQRQPEHT